MSVNAIILAVDDEPSDLDGLESMLTSFGYSVITAHDGVHALKICGEGVERIDLLITDVAMAPINGCDLAEQLCSLRGPIPVIFVSGYAGELALRYGNVPDGARCLRKPVSSDVLLKEIQRVLVA
jgi:two-component system cell cycle response regulator CpdR